MIKLQVWVFLLVAILISPLYAKAKLPQLDMALRQIESDIDLAKKCLPRITKEKISFCTGIGITREFVKKVSNKVSNKGLKYCLAKIEKNGYKLVKEGSHSSVKKDLWNSFYKTTKQAEALHDEKLVFIKKKASQIECVHELIHVLQWSKKGSHPLSPFQRNKKYKNLESLLLSLSGKVAQFEKNKQIAKAKELAGNIKKGIKVLKEYSNISSWLDEKDVYYFFYRLCDKDFKCSKNDWNTILANLFKFKDKLPWRFQNEIIAHAGKAVKVKEQSFLNKVKYNYLKTKDYTEISKLFGKSWKDLINFIEGKGIKLYQFKISKQTISIKDADLIPLDTLKKLPMPDRTHLALLLNYSKINKKYVLGKFICSPNKNGRYIIVTNNTSKSTLIHEYIHYLQGLKNPSYCEALTTQNEISLKFKTGEINRDEYEEKIIRYKILIWKTEKEVYKYMAKNAKKNAKISEFEDVNNKIQFLTHKIRLSKTMGIKNNGHQKKVGPLPKRISFKVKDDLPYVQVLNGNLVLDLGAMDSVINPQLIFDRYSIENIRPLKMKILQNALGKKIGVPLAILMDGIKIGSDQVKNSLWILANLKLPNIEGVLGLNFFGSKSLILYPTKGYLEIKENLKRPDDAFDVQRDYDNSVKAIEFLCPSGLIVRIDSGSQTEGDVSSKLPKDTISNLTNKKTGHKCGNINISGNFESNLQNEVIFGRNVGLNVGWPWINNFSKITISLKDAWVHFLK